MPRWRPDTELRYVPHETVEQFAAEGWVATDGLTGTHHGHYAVLMRRPAPQTDNEAAVPPLIPHLSVTPSATPAPAPTPNTPIERSDFSEVFRYVRHAEVPRFTAEGWELLSALDGTHHGEHSVLMRRVEPG